MVSIVGHWLGSVQIPANDAQKVDVCEDSYAGARGAFAELIAWSQGSASTTHAEFERALLTRGHEVLRRVYQGQLDQRFEGERAVLRAQGKRRGVRVRVRRRPLETLVGRVSARRHALTRRGKRAEVPMDRALNLPRDLYSHPLRERVADEARRASWDETVATIEKNTGAHVPKRQAELLTQRAAVDFDAFYEARSRADRNDDNAVSPDAFLVLTCDSKGVPMLPEDLRDATRKRGDEAKRTALRGDPMAQKKLRRHDRRMAIVTAVFDLEPHHRTADDIVRGLDKSDRTRRAKAPKPKNKRVWASVEKSQATGIAEMFDEADRRDPSRARTTVVLVDGEERQIQEVKAQAKARGRSIILIVDLLHVLHYLYMAVSALRRKKEAETALGVQHYLYKLLTDDTPHGVIQGLRASATKQRLTPDERVPVERCAEYLLGVSRYIRYADYLPSGLPIATGVIEGACRHLVQDRLGITGARWRLDGAEAILKLRALHSSGDLDEYWRFHEPREQLRRYDNAA